MLTGVGWQAGSLSTDQIGRVTQLVESDTIMRGLAVGSVGEWMVTPNAVQVLGGASPIDYLTRRGAPGYAVLLRQAQQWAGC
jgi:hypothetical protein